MEPSQKKALDTFLADNPDLEELSARLAKFNIFRALGVERVEIRHSNTLGWLLDPAESHGMGDVFLRRILSNMLLDHDLKGLSAAQVELMDLSDVEVRREWRNIDVLVVIRSNPNVVVLIENKVWSGEGKGQLARYRKAVGQEFPSFMVVPVFLTLEGHPSEDEEADGFVSYSHAELLTVLDTIVGQRRHQMTEAVATFLDHYTDTLRRLTMQDNALIELCQRIYRKHREAIDLIKDHGEASVLQEIAKELVEGDGCEILRSAPNELWFLPASWARVVPANGAAWYHLKRPVSVACRFSLWPNYLGLIFETCRMSDMSLRLSLVKRLSENGFRLTKKAFNKDATYSRFYSQYVKITDTGDKEEVGEAVSRLFDTAKGKFPKVELVLREVFGKAKA